MELITTYFALCNLNPVIYNLTLQGLLTPATTVSKTADQFLYRIYHAWEIDTVINLI